MVSKAALKKAVKKAPVKKVVKPVTAETYAQQDPDYRRAIAAYRSNLENTRSQYSANRNDATTDFTTTRDRLISQHKENQANTNNDFAARGMFGSGVYAKANDDRVKQETAQLDDATTSNSRNLRQLDTDFSNASTLEQQQESTAKAAAIRRASAKLGLTGGSAKAKKPVKKVVKKGKK